MARRTEIGPSVFETEYQGVPSVEGLTEFPPELFEGPDLWFDDWPAHLVYRVQALDPSKGSDSKTGDYQAHVQLGVTSDGTMFVDAVLAREQPPQMVARALDLAAGFGPLDELAVEDNDALGMLVPEFHRQIRERGQILLRLMGVPQTVNKVVRVRRLGIYLHRRQFRFRTTPGGRMLVDQLRDFPEAAHDGPDALELAVRRLGELLHPWR
jgi:predicted phage terminase large subunit-like protein